MEVRAWPCRQLFLKWASLRSCGDVVITHFLPGNLLVRLQTELVVCYSDELTSQLSDGIRTEDDLIARVISTDRKANGFYLTLRGKVYEIFVKIKKYCVFVSYIT